MPLKSWTCWLDSLVVVIVTYRDIKSCSRHVQDFELGLIPYTICALVRIHINSSFRICTVKIFACKQWPPKSLAFILKCINRLSDLLPWADLPDICIIISSGLIHAIATSAWSTVITASAPYPPLSILYLSQLLLLLALGELSFLKFPHYMFIYLPVSGSQIWNPFKHVQGAIRKAPFQVSPSPVGLGWPCRPAIFFVLWWRVAMCLSLRRTTSAPEAALCVLL